MTLLPIARPARRLVRALLVASLALVAGCENVLETVPGGGLRGVVLLSTTTGTEVARFVPGQGASGTITVGTGSALSVRVLLLGANDEVVPIAGAYELRDPAVVNSTIATAQLEGTDRVRVTGQRSGTTTLVLDVRQGLQLVIREATIPVRVTG